MMKSITPARRRWITVLTTLAVAFLSGHLMQRTEGESTASVRPDAPAVFPESPIVPASLASPPGLRDRILETRAERTGQCDPRLSLSETPAGLLQVALDAPCHPRTPLTLRFNHLVATDTTDARGRWDQTLPALSEEASISVSLADVTVAARLRHQRAGAQEHVILAWTGVQTFRIRPDAPPGARSSLVEIPTGRFTNVGDGNGAAFEIFSLPSDANGSNAVVRLSVDAEVTGGNCGRIATTLAYQTGYLGQLRPTEIAYTMPDCDRVGEFVRLQNLFRDLRLAGR